METTRVVIRHISSAIVIGIFSIFLMSVPIFAISQNNQASAQSAGSNVYVNIVPGAQSKADQAFSPNPVTANVGDTVIWTNKDGALHTVTSGTGGTTDSKFGLKDDGTPVLIPPNKTFEYTTTTAGDFPYFCSLHPTMVGTLRVSGTSIPHISISTDKSTYSADDLIKISGNVGVTPTGQTLVLQIYNPDGAGYKFTQPSVDGNGNFSYQLKLGGSLGVTGQYRIVVSYDGASAETHFFYQSPQLAWNSAQLALGGKTYSINYQISGGSLVSLAGDPATSTITAKISAHTDGHLTMQLPRNIADSKSASGADDEYGIFVGNIDEFATDDHGTIVRTLNIPFVANSQQIDIVGTFLVGSPATSSISASPNKSTYSVGELVTLKGIVTNANAANYITITAFNSKGAVFKVDQFHPYADGSFAYSFALTGPASTAGQWSVTVSYGSLRNTAYFSVQNSATGTLPFTISGSQITDVSGNRVGIVHAGSQIMVNLSATNTRSAGQSMIIILQIENSEGTTEYLSWQSSNVSGNQSMTAGFGWIPDSQGTYKIKALVWQGIGNPIPLADPLTSTISVV